jgi:predicted dehydrogenase
MQPIPAFRWGLIGPGRIARQFAEALEVVDDGCLHAVTGRSKANMEKFSREHGNPLCRDNHLALLEDPDIDAVYIATPHRYHYELIRDCLLAGKPVLCEKPLTVNALEARKLIDLSRQTRVFLMEALWTRFLPVYEEVNRWLVAGVIGKVTSTVSSFGFVASRHPLDRLLDHDMAGGALLDIGIYNLSISQWVFGIEPSAYTIKGYLGETRVDEHDEIVLAYSDGRSSKIECSFTKALGNDFTIHGSAGKIQIHDMFWGANRATLFPVGNSPGSRRPITINSNFRRNGLEYEIEAAQHCIRSGMLESPTISHQNTLDTLILMDELRRSIGLVYDFE